MKFGRIGIVLAVVIVLVGVYYFAPNLLSGVPSGQARMTVHYTNVPAWLPEGTTVVEYVDGVLVDGSFTVPIGTSHSIQFKVYNPDGSLYLTYSKMFNAPSESGDYKLMVDGTTRIITVVEA